MHRGLVLQQIGRRNREGVAEAFEADLAEAVEYAMAHRDEKPRSSALYGGGGMDLEVGNPEAMKQILYVALDVLQDYPF